MTAKSKTINIKRIRTIVSKLKNIQNSEIAREFRLKEGYPVDGFSDRKEYQNWITKNKASTSYFHDFMKAVIESSDLKIIDSYQYYSVLYDLYLFGDIQSDTLLTTDSNGCEWKSIFKEDIDYDKLKIKIEPGLYIKISLDSKIENIKDFINSKQQTVLFRYLQSNLRSNLGLKEKIKGLRVSTRREDYVFNILDLNKKNKKELIVLSKKHPTLPKDVHIASIMSNNGFKTKSGTVRKIISENKNRVKRL